MWCLTLVPLAAALVAGMLAWRHATLIDRQTAHQSWPRQAKPEGTVGLALGALVTAVAAATMLQLMFLPHAAQ